MYNQMQIQYIQLRKDLFKFYAIRLLLTALFIIVMIAYRNQFLHRDKMTFIIEESDVMFDQMVLILQELQDIASSINQVTQQFIPKYSLVNSSYSHCPSTSSYQQCLNSLNTIDNQIILQTYQTFMQFRCLFGLCEQVKVLGDFYWMFKLRNKYIEYIVVEYQSKNKSNKLINPPHIPNIVPTHTLQNHQPILTYISQALLYSRSHHFNSTNITVRTTIILNKTALLNQYAINMNSITISPNVQSNQYKYYSSGGILFGVKRSQKTHQIHLQPFTFIALFLYICMLLPLLYFVKWLLTKWENKAFSNIYTLDNLYKYQLNYIFQGKTPKRTAVLNQTNLTDFYQQLSDLIDKDYEGIHSTPEIPQKEDKFKFVALIDSIVLKFQGHVDPLNEQRSKQLTNLKFMIKTSSNQISQSINRKLIQFYKRARQLFISPQFFYFGYLSLLSSMETFQQFVTRQKTPLPQSMIDHFRYMNSTIHSNNIKFAFKFAFAFNQILQKELIMKIQFTLLQKYLSSLKELDFGNNFGRQLGLQRQLKYLQEDIDNKKYLFATYLK